VSFKSNNNEKRKYFGYKRLDKEFRNLSKNWNRFNCRSYYYSFYYDNAIFTELKTSYKKA
jgi:hypothetical protein